MRIPCENEKKTQYAHIDLLKAMAMYFVVFYHFNNLQIDFLETNHKVSYVHYFIKALFSTCVPLFFFVNGALLLNRKLDMHKHKAKLRKLIVLLLGWGILTLLIFMPLKNEYLSVQEVLFGAWQGKQGWTNHLWFLQALILVYVFFPLLKAAYDTKRESLNFFLAAAGCLTFGNVFLSMCMNVFQYSTGDPLVGKYNFFSGINLFYGNYGYVIGYFVAGGLFFSWKERFYERKWLARSLAVGLICMLLLAAYGVMMSLGSKKYYDIVWYGYDTFTTLGMVVSLFILSLRYKGTNQLAPVIRLVAQNSLGIYLIHMFLGTLFLKPFVMLPFSQNLLTNAVLALGIILSSLLAVLALKKIPLVKRLLVV